MSIPFVRQRLQCSADYPQELLRALWKGIIAQELLVETETYLVLLDCYEALERAGAPVSQRDVLKELDGCEPELCEFFIAMLAPYGLLPLTNGQAMQIFVTDRMGTPWLHADESELEVELRYCRESGLPYADLELSLDYDAFGLNPEGAVTVREWSLGKDPEPDSEPSTVDPDPDPDPPIEDVGSTSIKEADALSSAKTVAQQGREASSLATWAQVLLGFLNSISLSVISSNLVVGAILAWLIGGLALAEELESDEENSELPEPQASHEVEVLETSDSENIDQNTQTESSSAETSTSQVEEREIELDREVSQNSDRDTHFDSKEWLSDDDFSDDDLAGGAGSGAPRKPQPKGGSDSDAVVPDDEESLVSSPERQTRTPQPVDSDMANQAEVPAPIESEPRLQPPGADPTLPPINPSPGEGSSEPTILSGAGGNFVFQITEGSGTTVIDVFGGVGRGGVASNNVDEIDTIQFIGESFSTETLLLTQQGDDLILSFEGVADVSIVLLGLPMDELDNLSTMPIGNILFNEEAIQDSFDVFNAEDDRNQVFRQNTVTFLNDLDNHVSGFDNSEDVINGQAGNDTLLGLSGDDLLRGGHGDDLLYGGHGNDQLKGGEGNDYLVGGHGLDQFLLGGGTDTIADFVVGEDNLVLPDELDSEDVIITYGSNDASDVYSSVIVQSTGEVLAILEGVEVTKGELFP